MNIKLILTPLLLSLILCSCFADADNSTSSRSQVLKKINISDAKTLFIAPTTSSSSFSKSSESDKIFKITDNGYIEEVTYENDSGDNYTVTKVPSAIYNASSNYIIVCFNYNSEGYLVRKNDGAVFLLKSTEVPYIQSQFGSFKNTPAIYSDSSENIYYQAGTTSDNIGIVKINISNPNNLTRENYSPDTDNTLGFHVTSEGHMVYNYGNGSYSRIKKSNGGLYNLPSYLWLPTWIDLNGNIKYQSPTNYNEIVTVAIDSSYQVTTSSDIGVNLNYTASNNSYLIKFPTKTIIVDSANNIINEVENPTDSPESITLSEIDNISIVDQSNDFYYISGTDSSSNLVLPRFSGQ